MDAWVWQGVCKCFMLSTCGCENRSNMALAMTGLPRASSNAQKKGRRTPDHCLR